MTQIIRTNGERKIFLSVSLFHDTHDNLIFSQNAQN